MAQGNFLTARTEFAAALNQICTERGITPESVIETIKAAILAAYRKDFGLNEDDIYEVKIDNKTGAAQIFSHKEEKPDEKKDITPPGFGRIAAQTAKQVILQKIREAEKEAILNIYKDRVGTLVSGMVLRFDGKNIICDIGRGQGMVPPQEQVKNENYSLNKRLSFYIVDIRETLKGKQIILSRSTPNLVKALFKREVPEVNSGAVEIKAIAREAGARTKVAVVSTQSGVDPVGSCVGQKGVRVQSVIEELNNEKIDVIQYADDSLKLIASALAPAEKLNIKLNIKKKTAMVTVPEEQLSLAIGRDGQNVRLASKLTGYKIDIIGPGGKKHSAKERAEEVKAIKKPEKPGKKIVKKDKPALKKTSKSKSGQKAKSKKTVKTVKKASKKGQKAKKKDDGKK